MDQASAMRDIAALEQRLASAARQIAAAFEAREKAPPPPDLAARQRVETLEGELQALIQQLEAQADEIQRLRQDSENLRHELRQLSEAVRSGGQVEAERINRAMQSELNSLRAQRRVEGEELAALLKALEPLAAPQGGADARGMHDA